MRAGSLEFHAVLWTQRELELLATLCERYGVLVLSDEIHQDLVYSDAKHTMLSIVSEAMAHQVVTFSAPTKSFNLSGLMAYFAVVPEGRMSEAYGKILKRLNIQINQLGQTALCVAYIESGDWLQQLAQYLEENRTEAESFLAKSSPRISMIHPEGMFLNWLDLRATDNKAIQEIS